MSARFHQCKFLWETEVGALGDKVSDRTHKILDKQSLCGLGIQSHTRCQPRVEGTSDVLAAYEICGALTVVD